MICTGQLELLGGELKGVGEMGQRKLTVESKNAQNISF